MDKRIKHFTYKPIKSPFGKDKTEIEVNSAKAFRKLFTEGLGSKVLDQLILDMEYFRPDLPAAHEQMAFNAGKKYVINHILHGIGAQYEDRKELDNLLTEEEDYDGND